MAMGTLAHEGTAPRAILSTRRAGPQANGPETDQPQPWC